MTAQCPHCQESIELQIIKEAVAQPEAVRRKVQGTRLHLSWWNHGLPNDMRWLAALLAVALTLVAGTYLLNFWQQLKAVPVGTVDWMLAFNLFLFLVMGGWLAAKVLSWLGGRRVVEVDSLSVRAFSEPPGLRNLQLSRRQVEQFYVTRDGQLRCRTSAGHQVMGRGRPEHMRYVEQQLEEHMRIQDVAVEGEWRPSRWLNTNLSECPHCARPLMPVEMTRQLDPAPPPPGLVNESGDGEFRVSWHHRGPELVFLTVWLAIWDSVCLIFVSVGVAAALQGQLAGLAVFLIPHVWIGVAVTYFYLGGLLNRTRLCCDGRQLRVWCGPLPFPGTNRQVNAAGINQLYVVSHPGKQTNFSLEARCDSGDQTVIKKASLATCRYLEQELERFLKIANQTVYGEYHGTD